jgi:hypothetical protein
MNAPWRPQPTEAERDFHARYAPTPAATLAEVWALAGAPTARCIARHTRALIAALLAAATTYERIARAR